MIPHSDAIDDIIQFGEVDICVCDMNMYPTLSAVIVLHMTKYMKPGAILVLTVKECDQHQSKKLMSDVMVILKEGYDQLKGRHLLSNGRERTIVGRRKADNFSIILNEFSSKC